MKFNTKRYKIPGFGHFMTMHTKKLFNMELLTTSFMPGEGVSIPYLLIDIMTFGKKRTIFIEYYDCTANHPSMKNLEAVKDLYNDIPEYQEKPNWYVKERASYSLIQEDENLSDMIVNSIKAYNKEMKHQ
ncbi:hypothetical protein H8356DRAFT_1708810 [Neocallimastix lanati (nom. inval.)]|nr:hypothetical protein H8356DRAFT_1708810 [Neocallimastix sp. JGI-2020a]